MTRFKADRELGTESHNTGTFYLKRTITQNAAENGGTAILFGTGTNPSHIEAGEVTDTTIYKVVPQSAIVAEVFGTTGEAYAKPQFRAGVRWESKHLIIAATYGAQFSGSGGAGFRTRVHVRHRS